MTNHLRSDLNILTVQTLVRLRAIAKELEARGQPPGDVDREIRDQHRRRSASDTRVSPARE
jgi:hypothetical protein